MSSSFGVSSGAIARRVKAVAVVAVLWIGCVPAPRQAADPTSTHPREARTGSEAEIETGRHGMVVAGHPAAARIGRDVLRAGGTAMDAVVAVSLALAVAEPYGSGLGGKLMFLYREGGSGRVLAVDAMDAAPKSLDVARFVALESRQREEGWTAVAMPGLVSGLAAGHARWGRLPWSTVVRPAIGLARQGAEVLPGTRRYFVRRLERIRVGAETRRIYLPGGQPPVVGGHLTNPDLARTLAAIAETGATGFYAGSTAEAIVAAARRGGSDLDAESFAVYRARIVEPLRIDAGAFTVIGAPPPASGGATVLAALAALEGGHWAAGDVLDADNVERIARTLRWIYPRIQRGIADVPTARNAFDALVAAARAHPRAVPEAADLRVGGDPRAALWSVASRAETTGVWAPESAGASTTHFVVADGEGNLASVTQSLSHHFGAGVVAPGTGVLLNNTLHNFAVTDPESVNYAAPGKRPRSTIAPTLVLRGDEVVLAMGLPGGQRIPTATLQVLVDHLLLGEDLAAAIAKPRLHLVRPLHAAGPRHLVRLEATMPSLAARLRERGWKVEVETDPEVVGGIAAVEILPDGELRGIADRRRTNATAGY